ncbi:hypothetical protein SAMD00023353_5000630 [Rosellinia necatrix]|uniref:Uncharacterized protein n=1 Tax=Rosellinia necatrix TaxID=77044 RepID=A0A1W2TQ60_ROSNE|nr:hypothetical protein SAMD00023353_5000630 [Rosellinia necatrix]
MIGREAGASVMRAKRDGGQTVGQECAAIPGWHSKQAEATAGLNRMLDKHVYSKN